MTPREAKTLDQICKLQTDGKDTKEAWLIVDEGEVTICTQRNGEEATGKVRLSRRTFEALIRWYDKDQKERKRI